MLRYWSVIVLLLWITLAAAATTTALEHHVVFLFVPALKSNLHFIAQCVLLLFSYSTMVPALFSFAEKQSPALVLGWLWLVFVLSSARSVGEANLLFSQAVPVIVCSLPRDQIQRLIQGVFALFLFFCVASLGMYGAGWHQFYTPGFGMRASGIFASPNTLYTACLAALCFACCLDRQTGLRLPFRRLVLLLGVLACALILGAGNRAGIIGMCGSLLVCSPARTQRGIRWLIFLGIVIVVLRSTSSLSTIALDKSAANRPALWAAGLQEFWRKPVFGGGMFAFEKSDMGRTLTRQGKYFPLEPKNLGIALLVSYGIVGASLLLCFHGILAFPNTNRRFSPNIVVLGCMASIWPAGLFDTPIIIGLDRAPGTFLFGLLFGLTLRQTTEHAVEANHAVAAEQPTETR